MDTDDAFITQAPLVWPSIEDLSLRGWQWSEPHRVPLEGLVRPPTTFVTHKANRYEGCGQDSERQSSAPKKLHIFTFHIEDRSGMESCLRILAPESGTNVSLKESGPKHRLHGRVAHFSTSCNHFYLLPTWLVALGFVRGGLKSVIGVLPRHDIQ